ncbi:hypothetical protein AYI69_g2022 [Smittium culicis]|uniref:SH3 domain-containing protein n=1 Tax=Smittium culicis TaxID=133412 RepID=A0A1R1YNL4_9FUNG|nr:hypothetical protein AYI69_g2022 [Smittium culicis]
MASISTFNTDLKSGFTYPAKDSKNTQNSASIDSITNTLNDFSKQIFHNPNSFSSDYNHDPIQKPQFEIRENVFKKPLSPENVNYLDYEDEYDQEIEDLIIESELLESEEKLDFSKHYSIYNLNQCNSGEVSVKRNDSLSIINDTDSDWWLVQVERTQDTGYLQVDNIEILSHTVPYDSLPETQSSDSKPKKQVSFSNENDTRLIDYDTDNESDYNDEEYIQKVEAHKTEQFGFKEYLLSTDSDLCSFGTPDSENWADSVIEHGFLSAFGQYDKSPNTDLSPSIFSSGINNPDPESLPNSTLNSVVYNIENGHSVKENINSIQSDELHNNNNSNIITPTDINNYSLCEDSITTMSENEECYNTFSKSENIASGDYPISFDAASDAVTNNTDSIVQTECRPTSENLIQNPLGITSAPLCSTFGSNGVSTHPQNLDYTNVNNELSQRNYNRCEIASQSRHVDMKNIKYFNFAKIKSKDPNNCSSLDIKYNENDAGYNNLCLHKPTSQIKSLATSYNSSSASLSSINSVITESTVGLGTPKISTDNFKSNEILISPTFYDFCSDPISYPGRAYKLDDTIIHVIDDLIKNTSFSKSHYTKISHSKLLAYTPEYIHISTTFSDTFLKISYNDLYDNVKLLKQSTLAWTVNKLNDQILQYSSNYSSENSLDTASEPLPKLSTRLSDNFATLNKFNSLTFFFYSSECQNLSHNVDALPLNEPVESKIAKIGDITLTSQQVKENNSFDIPPIGYHISTIRQLATDPTKNFTQPALSKSFNNSTNFNDQKVLGLESMGLIKQLQYNPSYSKSSNTSKGFGTSSSVFSSPSSSIYSESSQPESIHSVSEINEIENMASERGSFDYSNFSLNDEDFSDNSINSKSCYESIDIFGDQDELDDLSSTCIPVFNSKFNLQNSEISLISQKKTSVNENISKINIEDYNVLNNLDANILRNTNKHSNISSNISDQISTKENVDSKISLIQSSEALVKVKFQEDSITNSDLESIRKSSINNHSDYIVDSYYTGETELIEKSNIERLVRFDDGTRSFNNHRSKYNDDLIDLLTDRGSCDIESVDLNGNFGHLNSVELSKKSPIALPKSSQEIGDYRIPVGEYTFTRSVDFNQDKKLNKQLPITQNKKIKVSSIVSNEGLTEERSAKRSIKMGALSSYKTSSIPIMNTFKPKRQPVKLQISVNTNESTDMRLTLKSKNFQRQNLRVNEISQKNPTGFFNNSNSNINRYNGTIKLKSTAKDNSKYNLKRLSLSLLSQPKKITDESNLSSPYDLNSAHSCSSLQIFGNTVSESSVFQKEVFGSSQSLNSGFFNSSIDSAYPDQSLSINYSQKIDSDILDSSYNDHNFNVNRIRDLDVPFDTWISLVNGSCAYTHETSINVPLNYVSLLKEFLDGKGPNAVIGSLISSSSNLEDRINDLDVLSSSDFLSPSFENRYSGEQDSFNNSKIISELLQSSSGNAIKGVYESATELGGKITSLEIELNFIASLLIGL